MADFWRTRGGSRYFVYVDGGLWTGDGQQSSRDLGEAQDRGQQAFFEAREAGVEAPEIFITHSMERHLNVAALNAALASVNRGTTDVVPPPSTPNPSENPNGLALLGSHPLASATGLPTFEASGATYPDDYSRFTIGDGQVDGGYYHIGIGKTPSAYIGTNRIGDPDDIVIELDVAFRVRVTGDVPYKLFRSIVFAEPDWSEAAVGHVWFSQPAGTGVIASDPARGVVGSVLQTVGYNDTANFTWEGAVVGTDNLADGEWHTVRIYQKLNSAGVADGICRVWIDGVLDIEDTTINWVDSYNLEYGFNAIFLEAYHNDGSSGGTTLDFKDLYVRGATYTPGTPALTITTTSLPGVEAGAGYSQQLQVSGGGGSETWTITAGSLSGSGLTLSSTGSITGVGGTPGTYNFTVQAAEGGYTSDTQALSIVVQTVSPPGTVWWEEDWDYADTAGMLAGIAEDSSTGPGGISLLTGLSGTPWGGTKALRCTFLAAGSPTDHQIGATLSPGTLADVDRPREIWIQTWCRWNTGWLWTGPHTGGGNGPGHKHFFAFDQTQLSDARWNNTMGVGNTDAQFIYSGSYGTGPRNETPAGGIYSWVGAGWLPVWYHIKMGNPDGMFRGAVNGEIFTWGTGGSCDPGASRYFKTFALSRNQNQGKGTDQTLDFGPVRVYLVEPPNSPWA